MCYGVPSILWGRNSWGFAIKNVMFTVLNFYNTRIVTTRCNWQSILPDQKKVIWPYETELYRRCKQGLTVLIISHTSLFRTNKAWEPHTVQVWSEFPSWQPHWSACFYSHICMTLGTAGLPRINRSTWQTESGHAMRTVTFLENFHIGEFDGKKPLWIVQGTESDPLAGC